MSARYSWRPITSRNIRLTVQYDGTAYVGWQRQARGTSIQGVIEEALAAVEGRPVTVHGAGRTDAGVHALGQVASFTLSHPIAVGDLQRALNAELPRDVRVVFADVAPDDFHARFSARAKTYRYDVINAPLVSPFDLRYAWHVPAGSAALDVERMRTALRVLEGRHDFAAFQSAGTRRSSTVRTLLSAVLSDRPVDAAPEAPALAGRRVSLTVTGDGFLRHMVRAIAGTLVEIGSGRRPEEDMARILEARNRGLAGPTAPAHGLWLVGVAY